MQWQQMDKNTSNNQYCRILLFNFSKLLASEEDSQTIRITISEKAMGKT
jgi:hypothetical protein